MTDEELGRRWCAANGKRPNRTDDGFYDWYPPRDPRVVARQGPANLPAELSSALESHLSESSAFTAVGAALRRVALLSAQVRTLEVAGE